MQIGTFSEKVTLDMAENKKWLWMCGKVRGQFFFANFYISVHVRQLIADLANMKSDTELGLEYVNCFMLELEWNLDIWSWNWVSIGAKNIFELKLQLATIPKLHWESALISDFLNPILPINWPFDMHYSLLKLVSIEFQELKLELPGWHFSWS